MAAARIDAEATAERSVEAHFIAVVEAQQLCPRRPLVGEDDDGAADAIEAGHRDHRQQQPARTRCQQVHELAGLDAPRQVRGLPGQQSLARQDLA